MKRIMIATLVGAVILFVYQFLSWEVLPIHEGSFKYTQVQDSITGYLSKHLHEDGVYAMPMPAPGSPKSAHEDLMKKNIGKPEAMITWHNKMGGDMTMQMIMGLIIDLIAVMIVATLMNRTRNIYSTFASKLRLPMMFGFFLIFQNSLMNYNWFHTPWHNIQGEIIDAILAWFLCGCWLAWYIGRNTADNTPATE